MSDLEALIGSGAGGQACKKRFSTGGNGVKTGAPPKAGVAYARMKRHPLSGCTRELVSTIADMNFHCGCVDIAGPDPTNKALEPHRATTYYLLINRRLAFAKLCDAAQQLRYANMALLLRNTCKVLLAFVIVGMVLTIVLFEFTKLYTVRAIAEWGLVAGLILSPVVSLTSIILDKWSGNLVSVYAMVLLAISSFVLLVVIAGASGQIL